MYEQKFPEVDDVVMVQVRERGGWSGGRRSAARVHSTAAAWMLVQQQHCLAANITPVHSTTHVARKACSTPPSRRHARDERVLACGVCSQLQPTQHPHVQLACTLHA
jgi:hypothetical protein